MLAAYIKGMKEEVCSLSLATCSCYQTNPLLALIKTYFFGIPEKTEDQLRYTTL